MIPEHTIFALSSGRPPAAIAVIRLSGPRARFGLEAMIGRVPEPRRAILATVHDPQTKQPIDQALALWLPGPRSETGEDMAELHLHGGRAVIAKTLDALAGLDGFRPAEAGEFTRRAFANGRIDLTAVEALADLIGAETEVQRGQAYRQLTGLLGKRAETWRARIIEALALVEAGIDFADEGDVPADLTAPALATAAALRGEIAQALADAHRGERLREGLAVAVAGPPNAGKSTLFNSLARREAAIVSPYPGTTRDVLELHLDLGGYPLTVLDTAGIRPSTDPVEQEGIQRARARAAAADLILWVVDAVQGGEALPDCELKTETWLIWNKMDLVASEASRSRHEASPGRITRAFWISARTGAGLGQLATALTDFADRTFTGGEPALVTRLRHRRILEDVAAALDRALQPATGANEELLAEELRLAARSLGRLLGKVDVEDVLEVIFRDFCIGK